MPSTSLLIRIIPADAGSTSDRPTPPKGSRDHPRGCGEHSSKMSKVTLAVGSSPRMRGALVCGLYGPLSLRIIPADAGSTYRACAWCQPGEDHPRGCGEHLHSMAQVGSRLGSSPRMRGALVAADREHFPGGIIPADAGSTSSNWMMMKSNRDHPRGCGEHNDGKHNVVKCQGSSPRMRGAPTGILGDLSV